MSTDNQRVVGHRHDDQEETGRSFDQLTKRLTDVSLLWLHGNASFAANAESKQLLQTSNLPVVDGPDNQMQSRGSGSEPDVPAFVEADVSSPILHSPVELVGINSAGRTTDTKFDAAEPMALRALETVSNETASTMAFSSSASEAVSQSVIQGGKGHDNLKGSVGDDQIYGRDGHDTISGNDGNDQIWGGNGNDTIYGGDGDDIIYGDSQPDDSGINPPERGNDEIYGGAGNDVVIGNEGNDDLFGGAGNDFVDGRAGDDDVYGNAGDDVIRGLNGNDDLYGGEGNDFLRDSAGADDFWGGSGMDTFEYARDDDIGRDGGTPFPAYGVGNDRIMDFSFEDRDRIGVYLNDETITAVSDNGSYTMLTISDGETLKIMGLTGNDFDPGLRFDSIEEINAVWMQYYSYDAFI